MKANKISKKKKYSHFYNKINIFLVITIKITDLISPSIFVEFY